MCTMLNETRRILSRIGNRSNERKEKRRRSLTELTVITDRENLFNMEHNQYELALKRMQFLGSTLLGTQPQSFNADSFVNTYNLLSLGKLLNQLGFSEHYMLIGSNSIYTENTQLIRFCKKNSIPLKVYHNYTSEKIEL